MLHKMKCLVPQSYGYFPIELYLILEEYLAGGTDAEENSVEEAKYGKTSDTNSDVSEVDAAFNDLLGS